MVIVAKLFLGKSEVFKLTPFLYQFVISFLSVETAKGIKMEGKIQE